MKLIRHKYSGKIMEIWREDEHRVIHQSVGSNGLDRLSISRDLFTQKWDYYTGPWPVEEQPMQLPDLPSEIGQAGPRPEKRQRGRPKGSKNKPKGEAA